MSIEWSVQGIFFFFFWQNVQCPDDVVNMHIFLCSEFLYHLQESYSVSNTRRMGHLFLGQSALEVVSHILIGTNGERSP
jgi:hypothetical protein